MQGLGELKSNTRRRFEFIEFQLSWEGSIGRKKLQDQFSISPQQATNDLTSYLDLCPGNMHYDPRQKSYVPTAKFRPQLTKGEASEYLVHLDMLHHGHRSLGDIWITDTPTFDAVSVRARRISPEALKVVLGAIRSQACLRAKYGSLSSESTDLRTLFPHAIANDGHRWHVRAYDFENERYSDFVLSRLRDISAAASPNLPVPSDVAWGKVVDVVMTPDPLIDPSKKAFIEHEYGMVDGRLIVSVRQAMLFYCLRHYGFDPREVVDGAMKNKSSFLLTVENLEEVEKCLGRR